MNYMKTKGNIVNLIAILILTAPTATDAQQNQGRFDLTWSKAFMENTGILHSVFSLEYLRPIGGLAIQVEVPLSIVVFDPENPFLENGSAMGNPRIGVLRSVGNDALLYMAGLRLPLAGDGADALGALYMGSLTDPLYGGAWWADCLSVDVGVTYRPTAAEGIVPYAHLGLEYIVNTDPPVGADKSEFYLPAVLGGSIALGRGALTAEVRANLWLTEDEGFTSDNPYSAIMLGYSFRRGGIEPSIRLGVPLSEYYKKAVDYLLSLSIGFDTP
jgi:hypothetical protein